MFRSVLIALCLTASVAQAAPDPTNSLWSPSLQVPDPGPEPEPTVADYKGECHFTGTTNGDIKPAFAHKDLSRAQCRREIKETVAFLKTWTGNVSTPAVACALYCNKLYKIPMK